MSQISDILPIGDKCSVMKTDTDVTNEQEGSEEKIRAAPATSSERRHCCVREGKESHVRLISDQSLWKQSKKKPSQKRRQSF